MRGADLKDILGVEVRGRLNPDRTVTGITADSRRIAPGMVFVAIRGERIDGHGFIDAAVDSGCLAVVVEDGCGVEPGHDVAWFSVPDSRRALGRLAAAWHGCPARQMVMIGVTGTNGKTTTSSLLESILIRAGFRPGVIGTVSYRYRNREGRTVSRPAPLTTPDPVMLQELLREMADQGTTHVLMEASSHALHQHRLAGMRMDLALFTNLSRDHLDYHRDMEEYFQAKKLLFDRYLAPDGYAVLVRSGKAADRLERELSGRRILTAGLGRDSQIRIEIIDRDLSGTRCMLHVNGDVVEVWLPLVGEHNVENMAGAAAAALALGVDSATVAAGLDSAPQVPGRLERVAPPGGPCGPWVFVDYAHTPDGLERVLSSLAALVCGRLICVFGCGGDRDRGKRPQMGKIAGTHSDLVVVTSDNPRSESPEAIIADIEPGLIQAGCAPVDGEARIKASRPRCRYLVEPDRDRAIDAAIRMAGTEDLVLVAGKGHEQEQIVKNKRIFFDDRIHALDALARWNIDHLVRATHGRLVSGPAQKSVRRIRTDSRDLGAEDVFVALRGDQFDGHAFVDQAVDRGAGAVIVDRPVSVRSGQVAVIRVDDTLEALGRLAAYRRRILSRDLRVLAVTGSSGKTTVKEMVAAICGEAAGKEAVLKTGGNFNNLIGLPLSLLPLRAHHRWAVLEMGMNRVGEIGRLCQIADPDIGCINNVQPVHLEGLGDIEGVARAKGELFAAMRPDAIRVVNLDDARVRKVARNHPGPAVTYAVTSVGRRHRPLVRITRGVNRREQGIRFTLHIGDWKERITVPAFGMHNLANCGAAAAMATAAAIAPEVIVRGLTGFSGVERRMQLMRMPGGLRVVNDCYNANPASMKAALESVATFGHDCQRVAALGDMLELGPDGPELHRRIGRLVALLGYDLLAVTGSLGREIAAGAREAGLSRERIRECSSPVEIADWLYHLLISGRLGEDDWLLVKGSRGMRMERLLKELQDRFDPARQEM